MKELKLPLGILIFLIGIGLLVNTLHGSVFYASTEDRGPAQVGIQTDGSGSIVPISPSNRGETASTKPHTEVSASPDSPSRLLIPSIKVDAHVQHVGINSKGNMSTPTNFTDVAWYKPGTTPGQSGSAVMAGHVDNGLGLKGVFKNLNQLNVGDDVYVQQKDGTRLHFVVEHIKSYPYTDIPAAEIFGATDGKRLNLITCLGEWLANQKTYSERLVVYTRLVE